ncbi:hypothetical protein [Stenotrophomonas sp.]|uniref:hypothetical protein n=1 Tax=Stenotrophomonas sp. TaxID=69392 RepID=UPI00289B4765|nr:hypothetical protein [Stenotrophomonas sp.]
MSRAQLAAVLAVFALGVLLGVSIAAIFVFRDVLATVLAAGAFVAWVIWAICGAWKYLIELLSPSTSSDSPAVTEPAEDLQ